MQNYKLLPSLRVFFFLHTMPNAMMHVIAAREQRVAKRINSIFPDGSSVAERKKNAKSKRTKNHYNCTSKIPLIGSAVLF